MLLPDACRTTCFVFLLILYDRKNPGVSGVNVAYIRGESKHTVASEGGKAQPEFVMSDKNKRSSAVSGLLGNTAWTEFKPFAHVAVRFSALNIYLTLLSQIAPLLHHS